MQAQERMECAHTRAGLITKTFKGEVCTVPNLPPRLHVGAGPADGVFRPLARRTRRTRVPQFLALLGREYGCHRTIQDTESTEHAPSARARRRAAVSACFYRPRAPVFFTHRTLAPLLPVPVLSLTARVPRCAIRISPAKRRGISQRLFALPPGEAVPRVPASRGRAGRAGAGAGAGALRSKGQRGLEAGAMDEPLLSCGDVLWLLFSAAVEAAIV